MCCAAAIGGSSHVVLAQDAGAPTGAPNDVPNADSLEQAREHMEQGQSRYQAGDFEAAIHEFEAAYEARPFSAFLYNAGVAAERLGQWSRAADYYERYLTGDPHSADAADVRRNVDDLRTRALAQQAAQPMVTTTTTVERHEVHPGTETSPTETTPTETSPTETSPTE
ncbi:MAG: tetratricopeptide repeat protein, partial [Deltaproteobacteria bacterium]|nr:tetratricopeptide repeat protein [Deltaproteobacteria bacterium]